MKTISLGAMVLAAGLAAAAPSLAQPRPAGPEAPRAERPMAQMTPEQRMERRAERLRATLQLRPNQEQALSAYLQALRPPGDARQRMQRRGDLAQMTTPQRLEAQRAMMAERQARFEQRAQATTRFYAQLTPEQQRAFDAMPMREGRMMRGKGPHRGQHGARQAG